MISQIFHRYNLLYIALCFVAILQAQLFYTISQHQGCKNPEAMVAFLDIGQGDSIYIQDTNGKSVLVDTGPKDSQVISRIQAVTDCTDIHIDYLLLTHPDADHIGEAKRLVDKGLVGEVVHNGFLDMDQPDETMMENELEKTTILRRTVLAATDIDLQDIHIEMLYPIDTPYLAEMATRTSKGKVKKAKVNVDDNIYSIVAKVSYTGKNPESFLLTGDASIGIEEKLIKQYGQELESSILKLGHHGSKSSTGQNFLDIVSPDEVVVSASKNNTYNHPNPETMQRVFEQRRKKSLKIRETSVEGNIVYKLEL